MSSDRHCRSAGDSAGQSPAPSTRSRRWALAWFLLAAASGCADFSRGQTSVDAGVTADAGVPGDGGALTFAAAIYPLLTICMNCHVPGGAASDSSLIFSGNAATDYT